MSEKMFSSAFLIGLAAFFVVAVNADPPPLCPSVTPFQNLNVDRTTGQWFVQLVSSQGLNALQVKCEMRTLTLVNDGEYMDVHVDFLSNDDDAEAFETNFVLVPQSSNSAYWDVQYSPTNNTQIVLAGEYDTYGIWLDCFQLGDAVGYYIVAMTRERHISDDLKSTILAKMAEIDLCDGVNEMDQNNCRKTD